MWGYNTCYFISLWQISHEWHKKPRYHDAVSYALENPMQRIRSPTSKLRAQFVSLTVGIMCVFYVSQNELRHVKFSTVDELCYLQLAVYICASQSELRHLQRMVSVCIWSRVNCPISEGFSRWTVLFTARCVHFMSPKVNCAIYSA